ncbi:MAG: hypothetical protein WC356_03420 [Candidatus Micrarchaeia archaeon]|jgi:hypothetical protein
MSLQPGQNGMTAPYAQPEAGMQAPVRVDSGVVKKARSVMQEYKEGKNSLERRVIASEQWYRMRSWEEMAKEGKPTGNENDAQPRSAWLFNVLMGKQADLIEAYPEPIMLPRVKDDKQEAYSLSKIVPLVMEQNGFEQTFSDNGWKKLRVGTAVYGVFWDKNKHNGLGDVAVKKADLLNLFWEPGIEDIQDSRNFFHASVIDNDVLEEQYPQLKGRLKKGGGSDISQYIHDDTVSLVNKSLVIDWYYKRMVIIKGQDGQETQKMVLHYCKFVGEEILFASENNPKLATQGWYDDGLYPYVFDPLFPVEGSPAGMGYVDIGKSPQESIDLLGQQLVKNAVMSATPRYFIDKSGNVNETEFADWTKPLVHVDGAITPNNVVPIQVIPLSGNYISIYESKLEEMKFTTGNQDVLNGGTGGMTTAAGQAAAQEAAGRSSKASTKGTYRAYGRIVTMVIERIRQFYDIPRTFRILGQSGVEDYILYSNQRIKQQPQGTEFGVNMGFRLPVFDIQVRAAKQTPFSRQAQNDMAIQLFGMGVFNPQMADMVVPMLEMMDFPGREETLEKVMQNQTMMKQLTMMTQIVMELTQRYEPENMPALLQMLGIAPEGQQGQPGKAGPQQPQGRIAAPGGGTKPEFTRPNPERPKEHASMRNARERTAQASQPD